VKDFSRSFKVKDFLVSGETFDLVYDGKRESYKTIPQPNPDDLERYYESEEYISHTDSKEGLLSWVYQVVKKWSIRKKVTLISKQNSGIGTLLDIGAGTGDFLKDAAGKGWEIKGVEPNKKARALAYEKGIQLKESLADFEGEQFDVITLWHVLEHIPNLEETIGLLTDMVKPNGSLIIAVPNFKSYDASYYGSFWAAYDVPRHLWHFSRKAISNLFSSNFRLERTKPLIFDSFYVSLLSEKYKHGKTIFLKGFLIGLKSNWKARTSNEYSSHIYCLRKVK